MMKHILKSIALIFVIIQPMLVHAEYVNTYTWALDDEKGHNNSGFPLLSKYKPSDSLSNDYAAPSGRPLLLVENNQLTLDWYDGVNVTNSAPNAKSKEFSAIYRARASAKYVNTDDPVTFQNWAFIRKFIFFGGDVGVGAHVLAPDPKWVDAAHAAGVKIYGTVWLAPLAYGGSVKMARAVFGTHDDNVKDPKDISGYNR